MSEWSERDDEDVDECPERDEPVDEWDFADVESWEDEQDSLHQQRESEWLDWLAGCDA